jgi:hypothetical protein
MHIIVALLLTLGGYLLWKKVLRYIFSSSPEIRKSKQILDDLEIKTEELNLKDEISKQESIIAKRKRELG